MPVDQNELRLGLYNQDELAGYHHKKVLICDVTLREGDQTAGVHFTKEDKRRLAEALDELGVAQIQLGHITHAHTAEETRELKRSGLQAKIEVMTSANRGDWRREIRTALEAGTDIVHTNLASSPYIAHMFEPLSDEASIERLHDVVEFARQEGAEEINVSLLDAPRTPWKLLKSLVATACEVGATRIRIPDSAGTATPRGMSSLARKVRGVVQQYQQQPFIGAHCHNDYGCATANTVACVEEGAVLIDLAVNGLGERAGNADLAQVVTLLETTYGIDTGIDLGRLCDVSRLVAQISGRPVPDYQPLVGNCVFADQEGIHIDAYLREPFSFQGFRPEIVGNQRRFLLGKLAGPSSIRMKARELDVEIADEFLDELATKVRTVALKVPGGLVSDAEFLELVRETSSPSEGVL